MMLSSRARRLALIAIALFSLIALIAAAVRGLRSGSKPPVETPRAVSTAAPHPEGSELSGEDLDRLRSLGYAAFVPAEKDPQASGVTIRKPSSRPGYNFFTNTHLCSAALVDDAGKLVNVWQMEGCNRWSEAEFLETGDILVIGRDPAPAAGAGEPRPGTEIASVDGRAFSRFLALMSWNGDIVWKKPVPAHHDVERLPDGRLLLLTVSTRRIPEISETAPVRDNRISLLSADGEGLESVSLYDLFRQAAAIAPLQSVRVGKKGEVDVLHGNCVESVPADHPAIVALLRSGAGDDQAPPGPDRPRDATGTAGAAGAGTAGAAATPGTAASSGPAYVLISTRHQDTVAIVDWRNKALLWAWGQGELSGPHNPTMLPDGRILVFDNGLARGWSRVLEVDPVTRKILWEYRDREGAAFFSASRGSAQRLAGGNTLIAESDRGRAFEVTPQGEIVWEFMNPFRNAKGERATITRIHRLSRESVERILRERGPGRGEAPPPRPQASRSPAPPGPTGAS